MQQQDNERIGVWLAGAKGDIATTVIVGAHALAKGLISSAGLTTELPPLSGLGLVPPGSLVFGGNDIDSRALRESAQSLYSNSRTVSRELLDAVATDLDEVETNILIDPQLSWHPLRPDSDAPPLADLIARLRNAIQDFRQRHRLQRVVVVNLTSAEPDPAPGPDLDKLAGLESAIAADRKDLVTPGIAYAYAALVEDCPYINFTPNAGTTLGAIRELAKQRRLPFAGNDGKTGETLVKTALAPMFASRNLQVLSWEGVNMLGNNDGRALDVADNRHAKMRNKEGVLESMLGYAPHAGVDINYVPSLGDWKTAWDLIHFQGFLDVKMSMQFTWQGCDSILAAPLVLDMVRLADFAHRHDEYGAMRHLAAFFKNPIEIEEMALWPQFQLLLQYAAGHAQAGSGAGRVE